MHRCWLAPPPAALRSVLTLCPAAQMRMLSAALCPTFSRDPSRVEAKPPQPPEPCRQSSDKPPLDCTTGDCCFPTLHRSGRPASMSKLARDLGTSTRPRAVAAAASSADLESLGGFWGQMNRLMLPSTVMLHSNVGCTRWLHSSYLFTF